MAYSCYSVRSVSDSLVFKLINRWAFFILEVFVFQIPEDFNFDQKYVFISGSDDTLFQVIMVMPDHFNYVEANYLTLTYQLDKPINEIVRPATQEEEDAGKRL